MAPSSIFAALSLRGALAASDDQDRWHMQDVDDSNDVSNDASGNSYLTQGFYWQMPGAHDMNGVSGGFSWYTKMFSLFQEGHPLQMQMGMASTWLSPEMEFPVCGCNPTSNWPGGGDVNCCGRSDQCSSLFETFEGGPGYWHGQLPASHVKWRANSGTACYDQQSGTPLFPFDDERVSAGHPHECQYLGIAAISNQMVMPPDGFAMEQDGMLGVAYVKTPIGKASDSDSRNFWTIVVDSENFAGPLAYWLPEYWQRRQAGWESEGAKLEDIGTVETMRGGAGAFEWNTMHTFKDADGNYKLPKMAFPGKRKKDGRSLLYGWGRNYEASELIDPIEEALKHGSLDTSKVMGGGSPMQCSPRSAPAEIKVDGDKGVQIGTLTTTIEDDDCVWTINVSSCSEADSKCDVPQYVSSSLQPITVSDVSQVGSALRDQAFPTKKEWGPWDAVNNPPSGGCATSPGPASSTLYCAQTAGSSWLAWRWYKFTEQPSMSRAKLSAAEKAFMQSRVENLHKTLSRTSRWIKARGAAEEGLATVDRALIVAPPTGMEHGYVPVAFYEGPSRPSDCQEPSPVPPSPPTPPYPPPPPTPPAPPPPSTFGIWFYQRSPGRGKAFVPDYQLQANHNSGRSGALAWDACGAVGAFDNGAPFFEEGSGPDIGAFAVQGPAIVSMGNPCGNSYDYSGMAVTGAYTEADGKVQLGDAAGRTNYFEAVPTHLEGIWIYQRSGTGKAFVAKSDLRRNLQSGRNGALAWDACGNVGAFDNGSPFWADGAGSDVGAFAVQGSFSVGTSKSCGMTFGYPSMTVTGSFTQSDGRVSWADHTEELTYLEITSTFVV